MTRPTLADLLESAGEIEPWLERRTWPPMTYMLIPGVLDRADNLIRTLSIAAPGSELARCALQRLVMLRVGFRRER